VIAKEKYNLKVKKQKTIDSNPITVIKAVCKEILFLFILKP